MDDSEHEKIEVPGQETVDIWCAFASDVVERCPCSIRQKLLPEEELTRSNRFVFEEHRRDYIVACVLQRVILSRYLGVAPSELAFERGPHGKPALAMSQGHSHLQFNLTRASGLSVLVVSSVGSVGVDAEMIYRRVDMNVVQESFAPTEIAALQELPSWDRRRMFFRLWTLKESYLKARGVGLKGPLEQCAFDLLSVPGEIQFFPPQDDRKHWQFFAFAPQDTYCVAVTAECPKGEPKLFHVRRTAL